MLGKMRVGFGLLAIAVLSLILSGCGGGGGGGGGTTGSGGTTGGGGGGTVTLVGITITPASPTLMTGQTQQYTATANYSDGSTANITSAVTWSSSNPSASTISASGLATVAYAGTGTTTISATTGGVTGTTVETNVLRQTWMAGTTGFNSSGVYGTLGVAAPTNVPGTRNPGAFWIDSANNVWMFGGNGYDGVGGIGPLNDLWKWNGSQWTWVSGSNVNSAPPSYGTLGVTAATNVPGSRYGDFYWIDSAGSLWMFGGYGWASAGGTMITRGSLNDLWKWDGTNWTWMSGSSTVNSSGVYGTRGTAAATNVPGARSAGVSWKDAAGNMWLFGGQGYDSAGVLGYLNDLWKWNGTQWTWVSGGNTANASGVYGTLGTAAAANVPGARSGAVSWIDASGNLWLFGGQGYDSAGTFGPLNDLWKWNGTQWTWVSGSSVANASGVYGTLGVAAAGNVPGARYSSSAWVDSSGNLWLLGGMNSLSTYFNDVWKWNGTQWTWVSGANTANNSGVYGTTGTASATNVIGARFATLSWKDGTGNVWLFGGEGFPASLNAGYLNDLWKVSP